jgi:hypothetical protein
MQNEPISCGPHAELVISQSKTEFEIRYSIVNCPKRHEHFHEVA